MPNVQALLRFLRKRGYTKKRQTGSHLTLVRPTRRRLNDSISHERRIP